MIVHQLKVSSQHPLLLLTSDVVCALVCRAARGGIGLGLSNLRFKSKRARPIVLDHSLCALKHAEGV